MANGKNGNTCFFSTVDDAIIAKYKFSDIFSSDFRYNPAKFWRRFQNINFLKNFIYPVEGNCGLSLAMYSAISEVLSIAKGDQIIFIRKPFLKSYS